MCDAGSRVDSASGETSGESMGGVRVTETFKARRRKELIAFVALAVFLAPVIAVASVGGFGFAIWMYQVVAGPPGSSGSAASNH